jgi:hypothetical protein
VKVFEPNGFFSGTYHGLFSTDNRTSVVDMKAERLFKSNPITYLAVAKHFKTNPTNIILIDDSLENRASAERVDVKAFDPNMVTTEQMQDIIQKKREQVQPYNEDAINQKIAEISATQRRVTTAAENKADTTKKSESFMSKIKRKFGF